MGVKIKNFFKEESIMKKILATVLALTMIVCMSITAFAAAVTFEDDSATQNIAVSATYSDADTTDTTEIVYSVDVEWESMNFTYQADGFRYIWNPTTFEYDAVANGTSGDGWNKTSATITITNRSNTALTIVANTDAVSGFTVTGVMEVATAVGCDKDNPPETVLTVNVPEEIAGDVNGNIVLTIAKKVAA